MSIKTWLTIAGVTAAAGAGYWYYRRQQNPFLHLLATPADPKILAGWVWPVTGYLGLSPGINAPYGESRPGDVTHTGIDIDFLAKALKSNFVEPWASGNPKSIAWMPPYTPAIAAGNGTVISAGAASKRSYPPYTSSGNFVRVDHTDGKTATFYLHLSELFVAKGDKVVTGQPLGIISNDPGRPDTGGAFDSPAGGIVHLHFEVYSGGKRIDPTTFLRKAKLLDKPNDVRGAYLAYIQRQPADRFPVNYAQYATQKAPPAV